MLKINNIPYLLIKFFILLLISFSHQQLNAYELPDIGSQTQHVLSYKDEKLIGESIYQDIQKQLPVNNNPYIDNYIQKLGTKLLNSSTNHFKHFDFFVINSPEINAFALPGGYIGVNRGLITTAENEDEIAAVLAHEISHVNQRHIARSIEKQQQLRLPMLAAIVAGALVSAYNPAAGQSIIAGSMAAGNQSLINYTRDNEEEADRVGMQVLASSGYSPYSMSKFFSKMQQNLYADQDDIPEYLKTHPVTRSRIADANNRADKMIQSLKLKANSSSQKPAFDFMLVKNMLLIDESSDLQKIIRNSQNAVNETDKIQNDLTPFSAGYALLKKQETEAASKIFQKLYSMYPKNNLIAGLYAETLKQNYQAASNILTKQIAITDDQVPLLLQYARLSIVNNQNQNAVKILKQYTLSHTQYPPALNLLLAESYNNLNQKWQANMAYADYSIQRGDLEAAIMQLKATTKFDKLSAYQQKIVTYRLRDLEVKQKEREERLKAWS